MKIKFKEIQKFTEWKFWLILIGLGLLLVYKIIHKLMTENGIEIGSTSFFGLLLASICIFGIILMFWILELKTEISNEEIKMVYFPFIKKRIKWSEIESTKIIDYGLVNGWGVRFFSKHGTIYYTKGNKGLSIELKTEKNL